MKYEDLVPGQCYYNTKQNDIVVGIIYLGKIYDWGTAYDKISFLNKENLGYTTNPKCLYLFQPICFITSSDGTKHIENIELYKDSMQLLENKYSFSTRYCLEEGRIAFKNGEFFFEEGNEKLQHFEEYPFSVTNTYSVEKMESFLEYSRAQMIAVLLEAAKSKVTIRRIVPSYMIFATATNDIPFDFTETQKAFFKLVNLKPMLRKE